MYKKDYYLPDGTRRKTREYTLFYNMLYRADVYRSDPKRQTYKDCEVSKNFRDYQFFAEWCNAQNGFLNKDENGDFWELDKDILTKGNKLYSEDTCIFVPKKINSFFVKADSLRGSNPIGVADCASKLNPYTANVTNPFTKGLEYLGCFPTKETAFEAYKQGKHNIAVRLAELYKHEVSKEVYEILVNYYPNIKD